jgi:predicted DNA-binding transcriptional regulator YafY
MKSERLIRLIMTLQRTPQTTASELADRLGVSLRTVFRHIDSLSRLGVPLRNEPGRGGGVRLAPGFRWDWPGFSSQQAQALALVASPVGTDRQALERPAQTVLEKLISAVPAMHQATVRHARERLLFDPRPWFRAAPAARFLEALREAIWRDRCVEIVYATPGGSEQDEPCRQIQPYALVVKVDARYLVAEEARAMKVFRLSRLRALKVLDPVFKRRAHFDLEAFWNHWRDAFERHPPNQYWVDVELTSKARRTLIERHGSWLSGALAPSKEGAGRATMRLDLQNEDIAIRVLLEIAEEVRLLARAKLVRRLQRLAQGLIAATA